MLALRWFVLLLGMASIVMFAECDLPDVDGAEQDPASAPADVSKPDLPAGEVGVKGVLYFGGEFKLKHIVAFKGTFQDPHADVITIVASLKPVSLDKWRDSEFAQRDDVHIQLICSNAGKINSIRTCGGRGAAHTKFPDLDGMVKIANGHCEGHIRDPNDPDPDAREWLRRENGGLGFDFHFNTPLLDFDLPTDKRLAVNPAPNSGTLRIEGKEFTFNNFAAVPADPGREGENSIAVIASTQPISLPEFAQHDGSEWTHPYAVITFNAAGYPQSVEYRRNESQNHQQYLAFDWEPFGDAPHGRLTRTDGRCQGRAWRLLNDNGINRSKSKLEIDVCFDIPLTDLPARNPAVPPVTATQVRAIQDAIDALKSETWKEEIWYLRVSGQGRSAGWVKVEDQAERNAAVDVAVEGTFALKGWTYKFRDVAIVDDWGPKGHNPETITVFAMTEVIPEGYGFPRGYPLNHSCTMVRFVFSKLTGEVQSCESHSKNSVSRGHTGMGSVRFDGNTCEGHAYFVADENSIDKTERFDLRFRGPISKAPVEYDSIRDTKVEGIQDRAKFEMVPTLRGLEKTRKRSWTRWLMKLSHDGRQHSAIFLDRSLGSPRWEKILWASTVKANDAPLVPCAVKLNTETGEAQLLRATAEGEVEWVPIKDE